MWALPQDFKELQEELEKASQEFQKRRSTIPQIKTTNSGQALIELIEVLSDRYFKFLTSTDASNVAQISYYQGCYNILAKLLEEINNQDQEQIEEV